MRSSLPHRPNNGWLSRRSARLLASTTLAITGCLAVALPAQAAVTAAPGHSAAAGTAATAVGAVATKTSATASTTIATLSSTVPAAASAHRASAVTVTMATASATATQSLAVPSKVPAPRIEQQSFNAVPPNVPVLLQREAPQTDANTLASTASALGRTPGQRLKLVGTALSYLGTPYVLGGASHSGIDCSGLTMVAYASIGISLVHYVPNQDAVGHTISAAQAKPGDLIIFNDDAHVGMYLGHGLLVAAPSPGRDVQIEPVSKWSGIGYHFSRILSS